MITILIISIVSLILTTILNLFYYKHSDKYNKNIFSPNNISIAAIFLSILLSIFSIDINQETLIDYNLLEVYFIAFSLPVLGFLSYLYYNEKISRTIYSSSIAAAIAALTYIMPNENMILNDSHSLYLDKLTIFSAISLTTYIFIYNDSYRYIQNIHYLAIGIGIFIAQLLGAAGLFISAIALFIAANNFISFLFNNKAEVDEYKNKIFNLPTALIISWIFVRIAGEEIWSLPIALSSYLILSFMFAIVNATINLDKFWRNNNYNLSNLFAKKAIHNIDIVQIHVRSYIFILIFSISSIFSSNPYGFIMIITLFIIWNSYKSINWEEKDKTIKEINHDFVDQLKENLDNTKEALKTISKNDNEKN